MRGIPCPRLGLEGTGAPLGRRGKKRRRWDLPLPCRITPVALALQKYNADYDLSATQGADTLAFVSLLEEKLLPVLVSLPAEISRGGT